MVMGILAMVTMIFVASSNSLVHILQEKAQLEYGFHMELFYSALKSHTVAPFVSIFSVLPFAGSYIDDLKSKFTRSFLIRSSYANYLLSRIIVCFLCGGFVIVTGTILAWCAFAFIFLPLEVAAIPSTESMELNSTIVQTCGLFIINGGLWAVVGMTMSTLMESKYIAYASPFVIYYLLVILCERYFPDAYLLYPPNWTNPEVWPYGALGTTVFLLELSLAFSIIFVIRAGRRLREL